MSEILLKIGDVTKRTTLSRSEVYRRMARGVFPKPIKIGDSRVAWNERDIDAWIVAAGAVTKPARA